MLLTPEVDHFIPKAQNANMSIAPLPSPIRAGSELSLIQERRPVWPPFFFVWVKKYIGY
jgi:hypothetical protein